MARGNLGKASGGLEIPIYEAGENLRIARSVI